VSIILRPCAGEPELVDPLVTGQFAAEMAVVAASSQEPPWCGYVGWRENTPLGFGGFKGEPDEGHTVEIGYLTFPAHEGQGVACAVAAGLVAIARGQDVAAVIAHTLPQENASTAVLRRNGFARDGEAEDPDEGTVWRWRLNFG
jgi:RimJ/RimL family protein N-acetyltransferase